MAEILIVDDNESVRLMIQAMLEADGHRVRTAPNGERALRSIRRKAPDVVLLDLMMPGMDGYEVLEKLREMPSGADVPVIVVTAKHEPGGLALEMERGAVDHVAKPFMHSELERAIERAVGESIEDRTERRRILSADAEMYSSIGELVSLARSES